jgi:hypothetical protein
VALKKIVLRRLKRFTPDILRLQGTNNTVTPITDYCYAPETLRHVAEELGYQSNATD